MIMSEKLRLVCAAFLSLFSVAVADPADSNPIAFTQNDGTSVVIQEYGDEHFHYAETLDGNLVVGDGRGNYVYAGADGKPSQFVARNAGERSEAENAFLKSLNQKTVRTKYESLNGNSFSEEPAPMVKKSGAMYSPSNKDGQPFAMGEHYFPVLLVTTADYDALDSAFMSRFFNEEGFKEENHYGSIRDYFDVSSAGQFSPVFDIYPITLPGKFEEYTKDVGVFMHAALDLLIERKDFQARANKYETDCVLLLHPTTRAKAKAFNSNYTNHHHFLKYYSGGAFSKNGYKFDNYAFISQKLENYESKVNMMGTFIHEFCHILGLKDTYANNEQGYAVYGPLPYDVMALGLQNGSGRYPATLSAFERETLGWLTPTEISQGDEIYELKEISKMQAFAVTNPNAPDEYYLIEYRPAVGFDSKIGSSTYSGQKGVNGILVWYIDYDKTEFYYNRVNKKLDHYRVVVKSAIKENQGYYADFSFVNKGGVAGVQGFYNTVFDGNDRVCFTVNKNVEVVSCPDAESSSSAEVASSSSEAVSSSSAVEVSSSSLPLSSSLVAESSSSAKVSSSSSDVGSSSSDDLTRIAEVGFARKIRMLNLNGGLSVEVPAPGTKHLKFFDVLGNFIVGVSFDESEIFIDNAKLGTLGTLIARLEVNGRFVAAKRVAVR